MSDPIYVEKFVTFWNSGDGWQAVVWDYPPSPPSSGSIYRLRIRVPDEVVGPAIEGEVGKEVKP